MSERIPPVVSVITPAFNASQTVGEAVGSALEQTVAALEVIVVDDGSSEPVAHALAGVDDDRVRIIRSERNRGVAAARNLGLSAARGAFIAQLDADDRWRPDHLELLLQALRPTDVGLAYSNVAIEGNPFTDRAIAPRFPGDGFPDWLSDRADHPIDELERLYRVNSIPSPSVVMRAEAVRRARGYPTWLSIGEDYYLYIKLKRAGWRFVYVDYMSALYRWPEASRGTSFDARKRARQGMKLSAVLLANRPLSSVLWHRFRSSALELILTSVPGVLPLARWIRRIAPQSRAVDDIPRA